MRYWNRVFRLLACGVFGVGAFFGILNPLFNNFIVDQIGIQPHELGYMESLREVPGFLNALFTAIIIYLAPPIVGGLALIVMGIGMAAYSQVNSFYGIVVLSFVWSIGFHAWLPLRSAMTLDYSTGEEKGKWFGQLRSVESFATLAMIGLCLFATDLFEFGGFFQIGGGIVAVGGIALLFASRRLQAERENRFVLRKKYWLYYLLSLSGWKSATDFYDVRNFCTRQGVRYRSRRHYQTRSNQSGGRSALLAHNRQTGGQVG